MAMEQRIKAAAAYAGISQAELARRIKMTPSNFNQKLKRETFTESELKVIAAAPGAEFVPFSFSFKDGTKI